MTAVWSRVSSSDVPRRFYPMTSSLQSPPCSSVMPTPDYQYHAVRAAPARSFPDLLGHISNMKARTDFF